MLPTAIHKIMITNMIVSTGIEFDPVSEVPIQSSFIFILCRLVPRCNSDRQKRIVVPKLDLRSRTYLERSCLS
jgi:hypothetical protein